LPHIQNQRWVNSDFYRLQSQAFDGLKLSLSRQKLLWLHTAIKFIKQVTGNSI